MTGPPPLGDAALHDLLVRRTVATAAGLGQVVVASGSVGDPGERIRAALASAFERHGGPLILTGTRVPRFSAGHVAAALLDLGEGVDASFGPTLAGGYYMAALPEPREDLFALAAEGPEGPRAFALTLQAAAAAGLELGMLRMERELRTPADARAMLADPLLPQEVRAALVQVG